MLDLATEAAKRPDARVRWLPNGSADHLAPSGTWNTRRLVIFTEYEATRRWLERRLMEALDDLDPDGRLAAFTGATPLDRREDLKRSFNAIPPRTRCVSCLGTDAAREGINLQARCHDLIHFDLPWNPARLEQRNGRIDRKLQPSPEVWCRYFVYAQREEDIVLKALSRRPSASRPAGLRRPGHRGRLTERLAREGIVAAQRLAREVAARGDDPIVARAQEEMDDETERRRARQARELDDLRKHLEQSRERVGVEPDELRSVVATALNRAGAPLGIPETTIQGTPVFRLDAASNAFATAGWPEALDTLRIRRGKTIRTARDLRDWRAASPLRALSFRPAVDGEGPTPTAWSNCIWNTGSSAACWAASSRRASSPACRAHALSSAQAPSPASC